MQNRSSRGKFIRNISFTAKGMLLMDKLLAQENLFFAEGNVYNKLPGNILLRSGWQVENIGDIPIHRLCWHDDHTDYMWAASEIQNDSAFVLMLDYLETNEAAIHVKSN